MDTIKQPVKPRILMLTTSAQANLAAGGRTRIVSELRYALVGSSRLTLLALVPPRQWLPLRKLFRARSALQKDAGCTVFYWPALPTGGCRWLRWLTNRIHAFVVLLFARLLRVDGIHAHGQSAALLATHVRGGGRRWLLWDVHGACPEEYEFATETPDRRWIAELESEERRILASADCVVFVSEAMRNHYLNKYQLPPRQSCVVPCATDAAVHLDFSSRTRLRQDYRVADRLVFVYAGSYRKYQMADEMVALFKAIRDRFPQSFFLILTGDQARFSQAAQAGALRVEDYRILSLTHEEVLKTLPLADVGFLLRANAAVNRVASPTKFAEYCICGVPVLLTPFVGDFSLVVDRERVGFCLPEFQLTTGLIEFLQRVQSEREIYAERCHQYASKELTWLSAGSTLKAAYARLASDRPIEPARLKLASRINHGRMD